MKYVIGIDIGTSSTKALLCSIDEKKLGRVCGAAHSSYRIYSPQPGWNEQEPEDWWKATIRCTHELLARSKVNPKQIVGIGLSGQMHGSVFLDKNRRVLRRALLWNDQRTEKECEEITKRAGGSKRLIELVNNPALTGYTAPKLLWLRAHEPKVFAKLRHLLLPKDYVNFKLTGELGSDVSDASGTLMLDVRRRIWSRELLSALDIDLGILPYVHESRDVIGELTPAAAKALGLLSRTRVVAGAGDQPAAAIGMGVVEAGIVSATIGTSGVVFAHADEMVANEKGLLQSFCHAVPDKWCVFGCMLSAGASLEWLQKTLYPEASGYSSIFSGAQKGAPGSGGLIFLPYLDGERCPYPDPHARGAWIGLSYHHNRDSMARALIEGITFGMADQVKLIKTLGIIAEEIRCSGGGAKSTFWLQLQADIYAVPTLTVSTENASALGAAILASVGAGAFRSVEEACKEIVRVRKKFKPDRKKMQKFKEIHKAYQSLYPILKDEFKRLSEV